MNQQLQRRVATHQLLVCLALSIVQPVTAQEADDTPQSAQKAAADFFQRDTVQTIHLSVSKANLARMNAALPERIYVPGEFRWGKHVIKNVGVRYKGNSSSSPHQRHKRSFLIKFDELSKGQRFLGLKRVSLDNGVQFGSLFSEQLITGVLHDLDIVAFRTNFAKLYLNGKFHGVYTNVERIDSVFLKSRFADPSGSLYKVDEGGPGSNLAPVPLSARARSSTFEPKSDAAHNDARDIHELIAAINETPANRFGEVMESTLQMDKFLQSTAVMLFSGAFDQLTGWSPHNYYLYQDPKDGCWHYLPWDLDVGFADKAFGRVPVIDGWNAAWPIPGGPPRPLIERIVDDPKLLARYRHVANEILEKHFHPTVIIPKLDRLYARIKDDLALDPFPHRRVTNPRDRNYEDVVVSMKEFMRRRYKTARAQLDSPGKRPNHAAAAGPQGGRQPEPSATRTDNMPTRLRLVAKTTNSVTLRWNDNAEGEAGHLVQRAEGEGSFRNIVGMPGPQSILAADDNVVAGSTYRYRVFAVFHTPNGPRGSSVSNEIIVHVPKK